LKPITFLLLLLAGPYCFAQVVFEPGYVIDAQGIKTEYLIKNHDWRQTPQQFEYITPPDSIPRKGTTDDFAEMGVGGQTFRRFTVDIDRSTEQLAYLDFKAEPKFKTETLFLKLVVSGNISLYKYFDGDILRYFYVAQDGLPQQLVYKMYKQGTKIMYNKSYKGTLQTLMKDKVTDPDVFKNLEYKDKDMTALFRQYNGVAEEEIKVPNKTKSILHFKAGIGAIQQHLNSDYRPFGSVFTFDPKIIFMPAVEGEWLLPFNRNKWSLFIGIAYHDYKNSSQSDASLQNPYNKARWDARYTALDFSGGFRFYMYATASTRVFVNFGYTFSHTTHFEMHGQGVEDNTTYNVTVIGNKRQSSVFAGAGVSYKKFSLEGRYFGNRDLTENVDAHYSGIGLIAQYSIL
jgi:hypothetical protein